MVKKPTWIGTILLLLLFPATVWLYAWLSIYTNFHILASIFLWIVLLGLIMFLVKKDEKISKKAMYAFLTPYLISTIILSICAGTAMHDYVLETNGIRTTVTVTDIRTYNKKTSTRYECTLTRSDGSLVKPIMDDTYFGCSKELTKGQKITIIEDPKGRTQPMLASQSETGLSTQLVISLIIVSIIELTIFSMRLRLHRQ